jgi:pimeloyl-ACP methyl ester carboxylesterase
LKPELEKMQPLLASIFCPMVVIQGDNDSLVPAANADFVQKEIVNSASLQIVREKDMDHFVPWTHPKLITDAITNLLGKGDAEINLTGN